MRTTRCLALAGLLLGAAASPSAWAQFAKAEDAVRYRQSAWFVLNTHFTRIGTMVRGRLPFDARMAERDAEVVSMLARLPAQAFAAGTDGAGSHARPEVWTEQARFREMNERMVAETGRLAAAARTQNLDQLKAAYGAASNTCKECHDAYRSQ